MNTGYGWLMLAGVGLSAWCWSRAAKRDTRLMVIYVATLAGAFLGAKLAFLAAEGWLHWGRPDRWMVWATGKSITGALLGGYAAVELAKRWVGYTAVTGDRFALIAPLGIMLGRIGCMVHGCCQGRACPTGSVTVADAMGVARWPAAQIEFLFNAVIWLIFLGLTRGRIGADHALDAPRQWFRGQLFHIYLMSYGVFRFVHEFWRETPRWGGWISGYQIASILIVTLGAVRFVQRRNGSE